MTLTQLKYFVKTCELMNMTEAASELHIAQPSLSSSIKLLESEFNVQLLFRNKHSITLTSEGAFFLSRAKEILKGADDLVEQMNDIVKKRNHIRVGLPPMIGSVLYMPIINDFHQQCPEIKIELFEQGSTDTLSMLNNGRLDIALAVVDDMYSAHDFQLVPIIETEVYLAMHEGDPLAMKKCATFEDIRDRNVIMYKDGFYLRKEIEKRFMVIGVKPRTVLNTNQLYTTTNMIRHDTAVGFMFRETIEQEPHLVGIPFEDPIVVHIALAWKKEDYLFSDIAKFIKFAESVSPNLTKV